MGLNWLLDTGRMYFDSCWWCACDRDRDECMDRKCSHAL